MAHTGTGRSLELESVYPVGEAEALGKAESLGLVHLKLFPDLVVVGEEQAVVQRTVCLQVLGGVDVFSYVAGGI